MQRHVERQAGERLEHGIPRVGEMVAHLRPLVQSSTQGDGTVEQIVHRGSEVLRGAVHVSRGKGLCVLRHCPIVGRDLPSTLGDADDDARC